MKYEKLIEFIEGGLYNIDYNGVYCVYHVEFPHKLYVGSTCRTFNKQYISGCYSRWVEHYSRLKLGNHHAKHLQYIVDEYGLTGIRFKLLESLPYQNKIFIRKREEYWINKLNAVEIGFNISKTADKITHTPETISRFSIRMKTDNPMKNKSNVRKMKESKENKIYDNLKIKQFDLDGNFIREWDSIVSAAKSLSVDPSNISRAIKGTAKACQDFIWIKSIKFSKHKLHQKIALVHAKYIPSSETKEKQRIASKKMPVLCYDLEGNFVKKFDSVKEASKYANVHMSNISNVCRGKALTSGGFKWEYCN